MLRSGGRVPGSFGLVVKMSDWGSALISGGAGVVSAVYLVRLLPPRWFFEARSIIWGSRIVGGCLHLPVWARRGASVGGL